MHSLLSGTAHHDAIMATHGLTLASGAAVRTDGGGDSAMERARARAREAQGRRGASEEYAIDAAGNITSLAARPKSPLRVHHAPLGESNLFTRPALFTPATLAPAGAHTGGAGGAPLHWMESTGTQAWSAFESLDSVHYPWYKEGQPDEGYSTARAVDELMADAMVRAARGRHS